LPINYEAANRFTRFATAAKGKKRADEERTVVGIGTIPPDRPLEYAKAV
jgi:hypothetical protein